MSIGILKKYIIMGQKILDLDRIQRGQKGLIVSTQLLTMSYIGYITIQIILISELVEQHMTPHKK